MGTKIKVSKYEGEKIVPPDIYEAVVKSYVLGEGGFGEYVKVEFSIKTGAYEGVTKSLLARKKLMKSSKGPTKLMTLTQTLVGRDLGIDEEFDLESLIGKKCRILLSEPITKDGIQFQKVQEVLASKL